MEDCVAQQYDALARMTAWSTRLRGRLRMDRLCMHKRLLPPPSGLEGERPGAGQSALNDFLANRIARDQPATVLDLGCGFGATLAATAGRHRARYVGVSNASFPITLGRGLLPQMPKGYGIALQLADLNDPQALGRFDAILALESLAYADCLSAAAANIVAAMNPGAAFWLVDDWLVSPVHRSDQDARAVCTSWGRRELYDWPSCRHAFLERGVELIEDLDLTDQVPATQDPPGELRRALLAVITTLAPGARCKSLLHAFLGGWHLERLYARGLTCYRLAAFRKPDSHEH
ncbi:MAG: class I SAM-dependent methyltransferase [Pseudomonadota bacterium]